ncbi:hypothetical protein GJ496_011722 [Pomphorhynchus laevis]|nr:hypothetical protein GJ496_011722 [Pomphorhynchus laevis]
MIDRTTYNHRPSDQPIVPNVPPQIVHRPMQFVRFDRHPQWYPSVMQPATVAVSAKSGHVRPPLLHHNPPLSSSASLRSQPHPAHSSSAPTRLSSPNGTNDAVCLLRCISPNVRPGFIPTTIVQCREINDSKSTMQHFLWEEIMQYRVPVLLRDDDNRFISKTMVELIITQNIPSIFQLDKPVIAVKPTAAELALLRNINEFHMAGQLTRLLSFDRWNDVLIHFDDLLNKIPIVNNNTTSSPIADSTANTQTSTTSSSKMTFTGGGTSACCAAQVNYVGTEPLSNVHNGHPTVVKTGWIQINNVFLPFVQSSTSILPDDPAPPHPDLPFAYVTRGLLVPLEILHDCPLLADKSIQQIIRSISVQGSTQDLVNLNKRISDARLASELLKPDSRLVQVQYLMACVPRLFVRFLPASNPKQFVSRRFSEASAITGGILKSGHLISPFIYNVQYVRCDRCDWIDINQLNFDQILVPTSIWKSNPSSRQIKPAEFEYFELLCIYFSGMVKQVHSHDRLISVSAVATFDSRVYAQSALFLEMFQMKQRDILISHLCKLPNSQKNVRSTQGSANNVCSLRRQQYDQSKSLLSKSASMISEGNQQLIQSDDNAINSAILLKNPSIRLCRDNATSTDVTGTSNSIVISSNECSTNGSFRFAPLKVQGKKLLSLKTPSNEQKIPLVELQDMFFPELENSVVRVLCSQYLKRFTDEETNILLRFKIDKENNYFVFQEDIEHILRTVILQRKSQCADNCDEANCDKESFEPRHRQNKQTIADRLSAGLPKSRVHLPPPSASSRRSSSRDSPKQAIHRRRSTTLKRHAASDAERKIRMTLMCDNSSDSMSDAGQQTDDSDDQPMRCGAQSQMSRVVNELFTSSSENEDSFTATSEDKRKRKIRRNGIIVLQQFDFGLSIKNSQFDCRKPDPLPDNPKENFGIDDEIIDLHPEFHEQIRMSRKILED